MLPEEVTKFIGKNVGTSVFEVEKGAIRKFADAVDDQNPLYWDEEYARNTRYGSMIAPPGFFGWPIKPTGKGYTFFSWSPKREEREGPPSPGGREELVAALVKAGYGGGLDGGMDYEFFCPIRAGDTLTARLVIKDIVERETRTGTMVFTIAETTYTNQNGDLVAKARGTYIQRSGIPG